MEPPDVAILVQYAFVATHFTKRFIRFRKWPSLVLAIMPSGWVLLAIEDKIAPWITFLKWTGVFLGLVLMVAITATDHAEAKRDEDLNGGRRP